LTFDAPNAVITGLVPVIHVCLSWLGSEDVDGRAKPGHGDLKVRQSEDYK